MMWFPKLVYFSRWGLLGGYDFMYKEHEINKISKEWIKEINQAGEYNTDKIEIVDKGLKNLKRHIKEIEESKNSLLNLTNIFLVVLTAATAFNTYYLFLF